MRASMVSETELSLPRQAIEAVGHPSHFDVEVEAGRLILVPTGRSPAGIVRRKLELLGLGDSDVAEAIAWARMQD